jgi:hypothetical protein
MTRRKSLFSRGSRCLGAGPASATTGSTRSVGGCFRGLRPLREYVCIGIIGAAASPVFAIRGSGSRAPRASVSMKWKSGDESAGVGLR